MSLINTQVKPFNATAFHNGKFVPVSDADLKGKWSVVVFYPADFTFVCPTELGDLADNYDTFKSLGVEIYGVSTDTHFTHKAWHDTSETIAKVKYPLIGDPTGAITRNFDVMIEEEGLALRYLRDQSGRSDQAVRDPRQRHRPRRQGTAAQGAGGPVRRIPSGRSLPRQVDPGC
jgi:peroxiredoxin